MKVYRKYFFRLFLLVPAVILVYLSEIACYITGQEAYDKGWLAILRAKTFVLSEINEEAQKLAEIKLSEQFLKLLPLLLFIIFFGTILFQDVHGTGIYRIVRYAKRRRWLLKKYMIIFLCAFGFAVIRVGIPGIIMAVCAGQAVSAQELKLFLLCFADCGLFAFFAILLTNLLSIQLGTTLGFGMSYGILLLTYMVFNEHARMTYVDKLNALPARTTIFIEEPWSYLPEVQPVDVTGLQAAATKHLLVYIVLLMLVGLVTCSLWDFGLSDKENVV